MDFRCGFRILGFGFWVSDRLRYPFLSLPYEHELGNFPPPSLCVSAPMCLASISGLAQVGLPVLHVECDLLSHTRRHCLHLVSPFTNISPGDARQLYYRLTHRMRQYTCDPLHKGALMSLKLRLRRLNTLPVLLQTVSQRKS
jgi:hypothetical protein